MSDFAKLPDALTIRLKFDADRKTYRVENVEVHHPHCRNQLVFAGRNKIGDVFDRRLATYLSDILDQHPGDRMICTRQDEVVDLGDVVLGRLRLLITRSLDQGRTATVRFGYFVGDIQAAFCRDTYLPRTVSSHRDRLLVGALESICLPLLDIVESRADPPAGAIRAPQALSQRLDRIASARDELRFYSDLLVRYVSHCGLLESGPADRRPEAAAGGETGLRATG